MARPALLGIVSPDEVTQAQRAANEPPPSVEAPMSELASYIRKVWEQMRRHRTTSGLDKILTDALLAYNGEYDPTKLAAIKQFGGSSVYARIIAAKCRTLTALLRDVYLSTDRPWGIEPTPNPTVPEDISSTVDELVAVEASAMATAGMPPSEEQLAQRKIQLQDAAFMAAVKKSREQAKVQEDFLDDLLREGNFYEALKEILVDLPMYPFAVLKGPTVKYIMDVRWANGTAVRRRIARIFWNRVSPFDLFWTGGAARVEDASFMERLHMTRADLEQLKGVPGYKDDQIDAVLRDYATRGLHDWMSQSDQQQADAERRESPSMNESHLIDAGEFYGFVPGSLLQSWGLTKEDGVDNPLGEYHVNAFIIDRYVIKVHLTPNSRQRPPYYITSFEKMPGSFVGHALPEIIQDMQDVANATLRSLVNNMSIASGPQVVVNTSRLDPSEDANTIYPWKIWHVIDDAAGGQQNAPIAFDQPKSNAQELFGIYEKVSQMADELSALPRYMSGANPGSGAGRTSSGLAMLMGNSSKILQNTAANIDDDIIGPAVFNLHDLVMLTGPGGRFFGDENIVVKGVQVAAQKETQRARQLEFLQLTANPVDLGIIGVDGRATVLKSVADNLGLDGDQVVPSADVIKAKMQKEAEMQQQLGGQDPRQQPKPGGPAEVGGPRANLMRPPAGQSQR